VSARRSFKLGSAILATGGWTGVANAHPGSHSHMSAGQLLEHAASLWHALPLAGLVALGMAIYFLRQRRVEKAKVIDTRKDPS
jgi:hypothetical protein